MIIDHCTSVQSLRNAGYFASRMIFRWGRECYGEAYVMFTGTADQRGQEESGDRLIKQVKCLRRDSKSWIY